MIDERAIIDPSAKVEAGVTVGPWSIVGPNVEIGAGTTIGPHVVIKSSTRIGRNNKIYQYASIGEDPQHADYQDEETFLHIGDNNVIREFCTFNRGTAKGGGVTSVGDNNFFMSYVHVAHDCKVANHTIFVNNASIGGHVIVENHAYIGAFVGIHQFCSIGAHSFLTATMIGKDVPPYVMVTGNTAEVCGLNMVGLKRRGFNSETITMLRRAYNILFRQGLNVKQALSELEKMVLDCPEVQLFIDAINNSSRGLVR
ncbi:MAG: acyl-ACP--UDP-N-acetylglucosamine O-acyltransferase [Gammaproteobacteria bacterium]|nr:acyl-ACP--UDP-N-acetylglucosamine O-acyltransferase [Gammaproteobacteria bacterium]